MSDVFSDAYWTREFEITAADLERIAQRMWDSRSACELTELTKRVIRGRLRHGPEQSPAAVLSWMEDLSVRLWDPAGDWKRGDHVIVARRIPTTDVFDALVGEVIDVEPTEVRMQLDGMEEPTTYKRATPGSRQARRWHAKVREVAAEKRKAPDLDEQARAVLLTHGERVGSQLLEALRVDSRFVRLAGRWFLRELAVLPTEEQLTALSWAMVPLTGPLSTTGLAPLVQPPLVEGDPGLFGFYLAMRDRPDLFANADPGQHPRWVLAGPPPGTFTPCYAAYDPKIYEVLCLPDEPAMPKVVRRLWDLDLLKAVVGTR